MKKAWKIFKKFVVEENNLEFFKSFCNDNEGIFSIDVVARLASIEEGIGYLFH